MPEYGDVIDMARGPSGRIVVEIEPDLKAALYEALARDALTFREWLVRQATDYIEVNRQPSLFVLEKTGSRSRD